MKSIWTDCRSYVIIFLSSVIPLALEVLWAKQLSKLFGTSVLIWGFSILAAVIGSSLGYFAARLVPLKNREKILPSFLLASAAFSFLSLVFSSHLILLLQFLPLGVTLFVSASWVLVPPLIPIGIVYVIVSSHQLEFSKNTLVTLGKIVALGAVGGAVGVVMGTLGPIVFGATVSWIALTAVYVLLILTVSRSFKIVMSSAALFLVVTFGFGQWKIRDHGSGGKVLLESESYQSYLRVVEQSGGRFLQTDGLWGAHAGMHLSDPERILTDQCPSLFSKKYLFDEVMILGFGVGATYQRMKQIAPLATYHGVEIDEKILELGVQYFGLEPMDLSRVKVGDARMLLSRQMNQYQALYWNISQGTSVPEYLVTEEFFHIAKRSLQKNGVMIVYINDPLSEVTSGHFKRSLEKTLLSAFQNVRVKKMRRSSFLLMASDAQLADDDGIISKCDDTPWKSLTYSEYDDIETMTDNRNQVEIFNYERSVVSWNRILSAEGGIRQQMEKHPSLF